MTEQPKKLYVKVDPRSPQSAIDILNQHIQKQIADSNAQKTKKPKELIKSALANGTPPFKAEE